MTHILDKVKHIHCIGIGGAGVSALAAFLQSKNYIVSGSDKQYNAQLFSYLSGLGVQCAAGHTAAQVEGADLVVYSSAISSDNVELVAAYAQGVSVLSRGACLAEVMRAYKGIVVAGTHGKTTTTALLVQVAQYAGVDPSYLIGGRLLGDSRSMGVGKGRYFIAESDESDGSFLMLHPEIAVLTNIDADHLGHYGGEVTKLETAFSTFLSQVTATGVVIVNADCQRARYCASLLTSRVISVGFSAQSQIYVQKIQYQRTGIVMEVGRQDQPSITIHVPVFGKHNTYNVLYSVALAQVLSISDADLIASLAVFPGVARRFEFRGHVSLPKGQASIFEDYGHHPTAITCTVEMMREHWPKDRIIVVFQPHRYTRTKQLAEALAEALSLADRVILLPVYSAGEPYDPEGSSEVLYSIMHNKKATQVALVLEKETLATHLYSILCPGDKVLFQGAGSVGSLVSTLLTINQRPA